MYQRTEEEKKRQRSQGRFDILQLQHVSLMLLSFIQKDFFRTFLQEEIFFFSLLNNNLVCMTFPMVILLLAGVAWTQTSFPAPDILYSVHADPSNRKNCIAACQPLILTKDSGFSCVYNSETQKSIAAFISPTHPSTTFGRISLDFDDFFEQPIATSNLSAVVYMARPPVTFWGVLNSNNSEPAYTRFNTNGGLAYNSNAATAYVAFGPTDGNASVRAYNVLPFSDQALWTYQLPAAADVPDNILGTPVYYDDAVYFLFNNSLHKVSAAGELIKVAPGACNENNRMTPARGRFCSYLC